MVCPSWGRQCGVADYTRHLAEGFAAIGVTVHVVSSAGALRQALSGGGFSLVHFQHEYSLYNEQLAEYLTPCTEWVVPAIATMHSATPSPVPARQHPLLAGHCRGVIATSQEGRQTLAAAGMPPNLMHVIQQGCPELSGSFADPAQVRRELGIPPEAFAVGFYGFAFPHKGIVALAQAVQQLEGVWALIQASDHWLVPGYIVQIHRELGIPGGTPGELIQAGRLILSNRHVPEAVVGRQLHAMDALMLPYSGISGVVSTSAAVRTALAAHRPVVTTQAIYFSDLHDEVYRIPDATVNSIRGAIQRLRTDPALCMHLAEQARRYAIRNRWEMIARRHVDLYRRLGCGPALPGHLAEVYQMHPDSLYDIPIQRERTDWLWQNVTGRTADFGCGNGYVTEQCGAVLGVDVNPQRLEVARHLRRGPAFEQRDITRPLPYSDHHFDTVLLTEVLQKISWGKVPSVVDESLRVGRRLVITVPNAGKPNYERHLVENPEHLWHATPEKVSALLRSAHGVSSRGGTINIATSPGRDFVYGVIQRN